MAAHCPLDFTEVWACDPKPSAHKFHGLACKNEPVHYFNSLAEVCRSISTDSKNKEADPEA